MSTSSGGSKRQQPSVRQLSGSTPSKTRARRGGISSRLLRQLYLAVAIPKLAYALDVWYTPEKSSPGLTATTRSHTTHHCANATVRHPTSKDGDHPTHLPQSLRQPAPSLCTSPPLATTQKHEKPPQSQTTGFSRRSGYEGEIEIYMDNQSVIQRVETGRKGRSIHPHANRGYPDPRNGECVRAVPPPQISLHWISAHDDVLVTSVLMPGKGSRPRYCPPSSTSPYPAGVHPALQQGAGQTGQDRPNAQVGNYLGLVGDWKKSEQASSRNFALDSPPESAPLPNKESRLTHVPTLQQQGGNCTALPHRVPSIRHRKSHTTGPPLHDERMEATIAFARRTGASTTHSEI
ncbi:hypothetical protein IMY05_C4430000800 [Salix suchowensis]|nr:hypothetical protein IMY05_C4430000800 [Salix suchowensis]